MTEPEIPKQVYLDLYPSAGAVVIHWALLEQSLEFWVATIYRSPGGNLGARRVPHLYKSKIDYLRNIFEKLLTLSSLRDDALKLLDEIDKIAPLRATIVHGCISAYDSHSQMITFVRLPVDKEDDIHLETKEYLSIPQILEAGKKILELSSLTHAFAQRLLDSRV